MTKKEPDISIHDSPAKINMVELQLHLDAIEKNSSLYIAKNFDSRIDTIDFIEFQVIDPIEELLQKSDQTGKLILLKERAEKLRSDLEEINSKLFRELRANIRTGRYTGKQFKAMVTEYVDLNSNAKEHADKPYYDNLDVFINGLFSLQAMPKQTRELAPEMVYYQKTPARILFEIAEKYRFTREDIFVDLGVGLGQAAILINLLTGITTKGVEVEPAFCEYAKTCVEELNLSSVTFINADARYAAYSEGTVFFMYTPFSGEILQVVLEMLRKESLQRKIAIITYGPCISDVASQNWLYSTWPADGNIYRPGFFISF